MSNTFRFLGAFSQQVAARIKEHYLEIRADDEGFDFLEKRRVTQRVEWNEIRTIAFYRDNFLGDIITVYIKLTNYQEFGVSSQSIGFSDFKDKLGTALQFPENWWERVKNAPYDAPLEIYRRQRGFHWDENET